MGKPALLVGGFESRVADKSLRSIEYRCSNGPFRCPAGGHDRAGIGLRWELDRRGRPRPFGRRHEVLHLEPHREQTQHHAGAPLAVELVHDADLARKRPLEHADARAPLDRRPREAFDGTAAAGRDAADASRRGLGRGRGASRRATGSGSASRLAAPVSRSRSRVGALARAPRGRRGRAVLARAPRRASRSRSSSPWRARRAVAARARTRVACGARRPGPTRRPRDQQREDLRERDDGVLELLVEQRRVLHGELARHAPADPASAPLARARAASSSARTSSAVRARRLRCARRSPDAPIVNCSGSASSAVASSSARAGIGEAAPAAPRACARGQLEAGPHARRVDAEDEARRVRRPAPPRDDDARRRASHARRRARPGLDRALAAGRASRPRCRSRAPRSIDAAAGARRPRRPGPCGAARSERLRVRVARARWRSKSSRAGAQARRERGAAWSQRGGCVGRAGHRSQPCALARTPRAGASRGRWTRRLRRAAWRATARRPLGACYRSRGCLRGATRLSRPYPTQASHVLGIGTLRTLRSALPRTTKPRDRTKKKPRAAEGARMRRASARPSAERDGGAGETDDEESEPPRPRTSRAREGEGDDAPADGRGLPGVGRRRRRRPRSRRQGARAAAEASSIERFDPLSAYLREVQRHPLLTPEETHALAEKFVDDAGLGGRGAPRHGEPAARGEDRLRVPARLQEHHGPHPGGQHRPDAGREALRPVPRREALVVRGVVDPRVHPAVHPEQLAPREARDDAGAAEALLQPAKEARRAPAMGIEPTNAEIAKQLNVPENDVVEMDVRLARARSRSTRRWATREGRAIAKVDMMPSLREGPETLMADSELQGLAQGEARRVPQDARRQGQGPRHLRRAPRRRRAAHAAGARRPVRHLARARAPARAAPDRPAPRVPAATSWATRSRSRERRAMATHAGRSSSSRRRSATSAT